MMRLLIPTLLALTSSVYANGNAIILNNSSSPIYAWSVGATINPRETIVSGTTSLHPSTIFPISPN
jgi:hypothetical protein